MLAELFKYYWSLHYWHSASVDSIKEMQLNKFRKLFDHAKKNSKFYREYYGDYHVLDLKIESLDDIGKVPLINKAMLRNQSTRDIMTCNLDDRIHIRSTSGSTGQPLKIAFNKYEDYSAHVRVFWALRKAGYRINDKIVIVTRYHDKEKFEIEKEITSIGAIQRQLHLFQREIISIYEPVDDIIAKLQKTKARILWCTPSIMQIIGSRLKEMEIKLDFPIIFLTSEAISAKQKELFFAYVGKYIVNLYGAMESPSLGYDFGLVDRFTIFPNANYFEFEHVTEEPAGKKTGKVVITNLINKTMPIIRYDLNDFAEVDGYPEFGHKYIKRIFGRQDDIISLNNGRFLAHHHIHEMFMNFHECEMFKFIQKSDKAILLQLKIARDQDPSQVEKLAHERWSKRYGEIPLLVEFVNDFEINPQTGKFKNIESK